MQHTVLLVDLDPSRIETTRRWLREGGFCVEVARDGEAGLRAFERIEPDLVLIEPMIPKKNGFQVCREVKTSAQGRRTPVVILTAFYTASEHERQALLDYGCDAFLERPISAGRLVRTCRRLLAAGAQRPAAEPAPQRDPRADGGDGESAVSVDHLIAGVLDEVEAAVPVDAMAGVGIEQEPHRPSTEGRAGRGRLASALLRGLVRPSPVWGVLSFGAASLLLVLLLAMDALPRVAGATVGAAPVLLPAPLRAAARGELPATPRAETAIPADDAAAAAEPAEPPAPVREEAPNGGSEARVPPPAVATPDLLPPETRPEEAPLLFCALDEGPDPPPEPARLELTVRSRLKAGELSMLLDGREVFARELRSDHKPFKRFFIRLGGGTLQAFDVGFEVTPGEHELVARVTSGETTQAGSVTLEAESGRTLAVELTASKRGLRMEPVATPSPPETAGPE